MVVTNRGENSANLAPEKHFCVWLSKVSLTVYFLFFNDKRINGSIHHNLLKTKPLVKPISHLRINAK